MSESLKNPGHPEVEFEKADMRPGVVYLFLVGLVIAGVFVAAAVWGVNQLMSSYNEAHHQPPKNPIVPMQADTRIVTAAEVQQFSSPRLETNERVEIRQFRLQEEQRLHSYGWVDESSGVVRIPIERAMELIAQRGLPTTPRAGEAPESTVKVIDEAARRSDTSITTPPSNPLKIPTQKVHQ